jgi:hypothetical protein
MGVELTTPHHKDKFVTKSYTKHRAWMDSLKKLTKLRNMDIRIGT